MPRAKRRKDGWEDPFDMFDEDIADMREHMDRILERMLSGEMGEGSDPLIYGFSMRVGPDNIPQIQEFGNARQARLGREETPSREPLTDIIEGEDKVTVIMELPGVDKEDIKVDAEERSLDLKVDTPEKRFIKHLELPCGILPDSAKASYKNGVLEVVMTRPAPTRKGKTVRVE